MLLTSPTSSMCKTKKRVIIIEDEWAIREAYKYYFRAFNNYQLVGVYDSTEDALTEFEELNPDIVLSDISLPGESGIEGARKYKALNEKVKIVILSIRDDIDAIDNLVSGNLEKPVDKEELLKMLDSLH